MKAWTWMKRRYAAYMLRCNGICPVHLTRMDVVTMKAHGWYECQDCKAEARIARQATLDRYIEDWKRLRSDGTV